MLIEYRAQLAAMVHATYRDNLTKGSDAWRAQDAQRAAVALLRVGARAQHLRDGALGVRADLGRPGQEALGAPARDLLVGRGQVGRDRGMPTW